MWGSDWPHVNLDGMVMPNDGDLLDLLAEWVPDSAVRNRILTQNPNALYGSDQLRRAWPSPACATTLRMTFGSASPCKSASATQRMPAGALVFAGRARDIDRLLQRKMREAVLDHAGQPSPFQS